MGKTLRETLLSCNHPDCIYKGRYDNLKRHQKIHQGASIKKISKSIAKPKLIDSLNPRENASMPQIPHFNVPHDEASHGEDNHDTSRKTSLPQLRYLRM